LTANRGRRRPKSRIDAENVRIFKCQYCRQPVTFSFGSVDKDSRKILTNTDGTKHIDNGGSQK
jgi:hypothetical protein